MNNFLFIYRFINWERTCTLLFFFIFFHSAVQAQHDTIRGQVTATYTQLPLPYTIISINHGASYYITDAEGKFSIPSDSVVELEFTQPLYRPLVINRFTDSLYQIKLTKFELFYFEIAQDYNALVVVQNSIQNRNRYNPDKKKYFHYKTYNKYIFTTTENQATDSLLRASSKFFSRKVKALHKGQNLLLIETSTFRDFADPLHQLETIEGARSSNISVSTLFIRMAQFQSVSIYNNTLIMSGKEYLSPIANIAPHNYYYKLLQKIPYDGDTLYIIKFNPRFSKNFEALKGILYIRGRDGVIQYCQLFPAYERKTSQSLYQSYRLYNNTWFTDRSRFIISSPIAKFKATGLFITDQQVHDVTFDAYLNKKAFDETILEYPDRALQQPESYWQANRTLPFSKADSLTYDFYEKNDTKKTLEKTIRLGESLYLGYIPMGKFNLQTNKLININREEGLRLGLGGQTNERFSKKYQVGGYFGFGTKDLHFKAGINGSMLCYEPLALKIHGDIHHEIFEAGAQTFAFDKPMFASEAIRKYQLIIMDRESMIRTFATIHPLKYTDIEVGLSFSSIDPAYSYSYKGHAGHFEYFEWNTGIRYAFGEQYIKTPTYTYSLPNKYPVLYLNMTKGFNGLGGKYDYVRWDAKIEQRFKFIGIGVTSIQLATSIITGNAPYSKLFNGKGSYNQPSVLIHNSFETMAYNEYCMDHYLGLFVSHNFGRLFYRHPNFKPNLVVSQNMGIGNLQHPEYHQGISVKNMNKGYIESGAFVSNIFVVKMGGLKLGLGAGGFVKYGAYASNTAKDNFVFKFALDIGL